MTKEEKKLLLKDLCARLPYHNTKCYNRSTEEDFTLSDVSDTDTDYPTFDYGYCDIEYIQPYLRPMDTMTEEESEDFERTLQYTQCTLESYDWLNEHHFDYRGLIEKGLALPAPKGMYKIE